MRQSQAIQKFQSEIWNYYARHGRDLPWRKTKNPYRILVSEIMLQQTQVERVIPKHRSFLGAFPDFPALAGAPTADVLHAWQGLGYNRRALALKKLAAIVVKDYKGKLPNDADVLRMLPGIGPATAGAVRAFAFNLPSAFIETNIRRVFIHFFFNGRKNVRDKKILKLAERTMDVENPREWHWALMDYGAWLGSRASAAKKEIKENPNRRSAHYTKQAPFAGSNRKLRGEVIRILLKKRACAEAELKKLTREPANRIREIILSLEKDGFVARRGDAVLIAQ